MCESVLNVCHASRLTVDDFRLNGAALSSRTCCSCDMFKVEEAHHMLMQCPSFQHERDQMFSDISRLWVEVQMESVVKIKIWNIFDALPGIKLTTYTRNQLQ